MTRYSAIMPPPQDLPVLVGMPVAAGPLRNDHNHPADDARSQ